MHEKYKKSDLDERKISIIHQLHPLSSTTEKLEFQTSFLNSGECMNNKRYVNKLLTFKILLIYKSVFLFLLNTYYTVQVNKFAKIRIICNVFLNLSLYDPHQKLGLI